jgi:hypothetical protein
MFRKPLSRLHESPVSDVVLASVSAVARRWPTLAFLSFALLIIGLDSTVMDYLLPSLPGQPDADGSALRWIERAKAVGDWSRTAAAGAGLGPVAGGVLLVVSTGRLATRSDARR